MGYKDRLKERIDVLARRCKRNTPQSMGAFSARAARCVAAENVKEWDMLAQYIAENYSVPYDWTLTLVRMMRPDVKEGVQC